MKTTQWRCLKLLYYQTFQSPIGPLSIYANDYHLIHLVIGVDKTIDAIWNESHPILSQVSSQLQAYFQRELSTFTLPILLQGTPFQIAVWTALKNIPFGQVMSYQQIAYQIGYPKASRAVGQACKRNPLLLVIPCHRVIGSNGELGGFTGGLDVKKWLLNHET